MSKISDKLLLAKSILSNPQIIRVSPSINIFLTKYMQKFNLVKAGGRLVLHSHLPAINSPAFSRFISEHLLARAEGPTHAQIGLTNACPQNCDYCYNKSRSGQIMDKDTIKRVIKDLKDMGVIWLGLTGGEPLLNKDIVEIVDSIGDGCAIKMFTGGYNLTSQLASDLKKAGLFYVSVSLDHWQAQEHDKGRGCQGSFETALRAINIFNDIGGIHVGVSTVLSRSMLNSGQAEEFMGFLIKLGIHEAWLSETKPAIKPLWDQDVIITEEERHGLIRLQDRYNKQGKITVNYLGHFESGDNFGCNAGHKMVYIDAFGEVSPCVFAPITFGNVSEESVQSIFEKMKESFQPHSCCFVNTNYQLFDRYFKGQYPIGEEDTIKIMKEARFGEMPEFFKRY
ncbi:MAG: radical SAM protein [Syntrophomonas sp.]